MNPTSITPRPRVVILGAGFGGLSVAKGLANSPFDVTIVDQHNYHLFQPLLYQVATAGLSPADIASPIRSIMRDARNVSVVLAKVGKIDVGRREVVAENRHLPFDYLIVATGAQHAYFGHDEWEAAAPGLKTIDDATYLRRRILLAFEKAETEPDPAERTRLLNFIVVGGGPTGVEMAGAIAELAKRALAGDIECLAWLRVSIPQQRSRSTIHRRGDAALFAHHTHLRRLRPFRCDRKTDSEARQSFINA